MANPENFMKCIFAPKHATFQDQEAKSDHQYADAGGTQPSEEDWAQPRQEGGRVQRIPKLQEGGTRKDKGSTNCASHCMQEI